jgi:HSP20 family protein
MGANPRTGWAGESTPIIGRTTACDLAEKNSSLESKGDRPMARWQTFQPVWGQLQQLQSEMNRLFQRWGDGGLRGLGLAAYPPVNVWEENDTIYVQAELPGMRLEDLEIYVTGSDQLTLKGERKPAAAVKGVVQHRQERGFGSFVRVLPLPFAVDANQVEARLENGVLLVKLPKHESAKPRKIVVKAAE